MTALANHVVSTYEGSPVLHKLEFKALSYYLFLAIPVAVVLTKVDEICSDVNRDVSVVFRSIPVKDCIDVISEKLGTPPNVVLPVSGIIQC